MDKKEYITVYEADDGTRFRDKKLCGEYEELLSSLRKYHISYAPDLTEGRYMKKSIDILVDSSKVDRSMMEYLCSLKFGCPIQFVMGFISRNTVMPAWTIREEDVDRLMDGAVFVYLDTQGVSDNLASYLDRRLRKVVKLSNWQGDFMEVFE